MFPELAQTIIYLVVGGYLVFLAITVTRDNLSNRVNRITGSMLFFAGLGPIALALGTLLTRGTMGPPLAQTRLFGLFLVWEFFFPALVVFALHFPVDRIRSARRERILLLLILPQAVHILLILLFSELTGLTTALEEAAAQGGFLSIILGPLSFTMSRLMLLLGFVRTYADVIFGIANLVYAAAAVYLLESGRKYLGNPRLVSQTVVVVWGIRIGVGLYVVSYVLLIAIDSRPWFDLITALRMLAPVSGAGFFTYAIIKHQFLDIRLIFRQSLIYTVTTTLLVGSYVLFSLKAKDLLTPLFQERAEAVSYMVIVFLLLLFPPVSNWIDTVVRSMFMRTTSDHRNILQRFSRQVISLFEPAQIRQAIEETLKTSLLVDNVYFVLYDDSVGEYAILRSDDYDRRTVINRDDLMLRGINLLDKPTNYPSLSDYEAGSQLASILRELRIKLILPLKDSHHLLGFLALTSKAAGYRYTPEDYNLLGVLSNQMVSALTNARLYADSLEKIRLEEEVSMARQIQVNLLPDSPPESPVAVICAESTPSLTVGGDFYDFISIEKHRRVGIVIADASGKGMPAALLVAQIQAIIRSEVNNGNPIPTIMKNTNRQILSATSAEKYVTLFYGELDHESCEFYYANAGHNYPILVRSNGETEYLDQGGPLIGALPDMDYAAATVRLEKDDLLLLFTDGLSEAMNGQGEEYGEERIRDFIVQKRKNDPRSIISELVRDVRAFDPSYPPKDDTTIVAVKIRNGIETYGKTSPAI